jgi:predicted alpha/beta-fold hydrolase
MLTSTPMTSTPTCPTGNEHFLPPWYFRNGHLQTLAGMYIYAPLSIRKQFWPNTTRTGEVLLSDGDRLIYQDDCPTDWQPGDRVALLLHGLGGSHASPYLSRIARQLNKNNTRTFRLDWRGCGAGAGLARYPYHSGRSDDLSATVSEIVALCPDSPISLVGFSLGGNVTLKMLGETSASVGHLSTIDRAIAICPPIDLNFTVKSMQKGLGRLYDRYFCQNCTRDVYLRQRQALKAVIPEGWFSRRPRTLYEFDETFTAPVCGFESASDYYAKSSANQFLEAITVPTLVIAAQDDPLIPFSQFRVASYSATTKLLSPRHGGHLGFCTTQGQGWMDKQIIEWIVGKL